MLALRSQRDLLAAIARARSITLVAYLLPHGAVFDALASAAKRGARVTVRLEGRPYYDARGGVHRLNQSAVDELSHAGADARLVDPGGTAPLHAKALLAGDALYLDDVNFARDGTLVRDLARADVRALRDAIAGRLDAPSRNFALRKRDALQMEAAMLAASRGHDGVAVESESIGSGNAVYSELERLGRAGDAPRLLISREALSMKERSRLQRLEVNGVRVRVCGSNEKFALTGDRAWLGSANATSAYCDPEQLDWGARTHSRSIVAQLRSRFEARWQSAHELCG